MPLQPAGRRRLAAFGAALLTIALGLCLRLIPLGLPSWAVKYGGSALWAVMIYWLIVIAQPLWPGLQLTITATLIAWLVELFKLVRTPALDAFRLTLAGKLLLGRFFSYQDLAVYLAAITAMAALDRLSSGKPPAAYRPPQS